MNKKRKREEENFEKIKKKKFETEGYLFINIRVFKKYN